MEWKGMCPYCGSYDIELEDDDGACWGNDDQGWICEHWSCRICHRAFDTEGQIQVISRKFLEE